MKYILLILCVISAGCYDPALKLMVYNNDDSDIELHTNKTIAKIKAGTMQVVRYPSIFDQKTYKYHIVISDDKCVYSYLVDHSFLLKSKDNYTKMPGYTGVINFQYNQDHKIYLVDPIVKDFPVEIEKIQKMQIFHFPVQAVEKKCIK